MLTSSFPCAIPLEIHAIYTRAAQCDHILYLLATEVNSRWARQRAKQTRYEKKRREVTRVEEERKREWKQETIKMRREEIKRYSRRRRSKRKT